MILRRMQADLPRGAFTLSFDFELVWGSRDLVSDPAPLVAEAHITRDQIFEPLLHALQRLGVCATWATVGQLFLGGARAGPGGLHPGVVPPQHAWRRAPWWQGVPEGTEAEHPAWYGRSLVQRLAQAGQEVGSHSFSHPVFGDPGCPREAADTDLAAAVAAAAELGLRLRSFVFPRNVVGHLDLLAKHGFTCWRSPEPDLAHHPRLPRPAQRLVHLAEVAAARTPPMVVPRKDAHGLWDIPGSAVFLPAHGVRRAIPISRRVRRSTRGIDRAIAERKLFHLYLHPINLASAPGPMLAGLIAVLEHAARARDAGRLDILAMGQLADRCEAGSR